jgi:hypothetical protein
MMNCYTFKRFTKSFPNVSLSVIPEFYDRYVFVECAGEQYGSQFSRLNGSSYILAKWADRYDGNINLNASDARPGIVLYLIKQTVSVFARFAWLMLTGFSTTLAVSIVAHLVLSQKFGAQTYLIVLVPLHLCQFRGFGESSWLVTINA